MQNQDKGLRCWDLDTIQTLNCTSIAYHLKHFSVCTCNNIHVETLIRPQNSHIKLKFYFYFISLWITILKIIIFGTFLY